jgi:hypothetical protein
MTDVSGLDAFTMLEGGLQFAFGMLETVGGFATAIASPAGGPACPALALGGTAVAMHGLDTAATGIATMVSGDSQMTLFQHSIQVTTGMSEQAARLADMAFSICSPLALARMMMSQTAKSIPTFCKVFFSGDKHVGKTASMLENIFPGRVQAVNIHMPAAVASRTRELDIVMDQFVIQVKSGTGKGLVGQIRKTMETLYDTSRRVIGYAPDNFSRHALMEAVEAEIPIATTFEELVAIIREFSN